MVRQTAFAFAFVALGLSRDPGGCGGVDDPQGGTNAPCTRNSDCRSGLKCSEGVCIDPTADTDASTPAKDGGDAKDASDDGG